MKVSLNTIKQYVDFELPTVDELKKRISEQLGKVENIIDLKAKYHGIVIVKVISAIKHPNADKLTVCLVDDGGVVMDMPRDENGYVQVVCGAPNVHSDMFAIWLPPAVTVPASFDTAEPFVLSARELRGVVSNGMLAAADELAIGSDHNGIIELTAGDMNGVELKPGLDFAETFGLNDTTIDIENKMFTHRPDCFGQLGVAREIAGILGYKFTSPDWYLNTPEFASASGLELTVTNDAPEKVPRFMAVAIKDVVVQPSPFWLQAKLVALGSKPINNVVDITNYVMLITAQPLHAYDYDKLAGRALGVRMGRAGETLPLLNGKSYAVTPDDIVIVDGEKPIGMGGIMGGGNSEVSTDTKNIVLECATFDMYTIRKTSMRHGLFTDAVTRFNKGQSPLQNAVVVAKSIELMEQFTGGAQASAVYDIASDETRDTGYDITVSPDFINERLGLRLNVEKMSELLNNVEFSTLVSHDSRLVTLTWPFWRTDIELPEDVVEEVGRLYGFDKLPLEMPVKSIKPVAKNARREAARAVREQLASAGANEVLTYSFVHENILKRAGQDPEHAYRLGNALSPDLQFYRLGLTPSLLDKIHGNLKAGHEAFALFELNKVHYKGEMDMDEPTVPNEDNHLGLVLAYSDKQKPAGAAFYQALNYLAQAVDLPSMQLLPMAHFDMSNDDWGAQLTAPYLAERSVLIMKNNQVYGVVGEYKPAVRQAFKLPDYTAGFEINTDALVLHTTDYQPLSRYPSVTQDISLRVAASVQYLAVYNAVTGAVSIPDINVRVLPVSIYQGNDGANKTITLRLQFTSNENTLTDAQVAPLMDSAAQAAAEKVQAERV